MATLPHGGCFICNAGGRGRSAQERRNRKVNRHPATHHDLSNVFRAGPVALSLALASQPCVDVRSVVTREIYASFERSSPSDTASGLSHIQTNGCMY